MKKYLFLLMLAGVLGFTSCGDDEKPYVKPLNKLTKVTCTLNDASLPLYTVNIIYTTDGQIASISREDGDKQLLIYAGNTLTVTGVSGVEKIEYGLSGSTIKSKKIWKSNPYSASTVYVSDDFRYNYSGSYWTATDWIVQMPETNGTGYERKEYKNDETFVWENNNVINFSQDKKITVYAYASELCPSNFPFRITGHMNPSSFDMFSPLNFQMGARNKNLPIYAYSYTIPETTSKHAEYTFAYTTSLQDYLTGLTIFEKTHNPTLGDVTNEYRYTFEYNYESK